MPGLHSFAHSIFIQFCLNCAAVYSFLYLNRKLQIFCGFSWVALFLSYYDIQKYKC